MRLWHLAACVGAAVALAGCDFGSGQPATRGGDPPAGGDSTIDVVPATYATLDAAVKENKGKVVVVDFWATWCPPCVKRFPHLVSMHNKYAGEGLVCISVSQDNMVDRPEVVKFLRNQEATFTNFIWNDNTREGHRNVTERFRLGGYIPHMTVFGRNGEIAYAGVEKGPEEVEEVVKDELARK
jgi:thiol-disulfide isomerase/thioredoxin